MPPAEARGGKPSARSASLAVARVMVPKKLSAEEKELLEKLRELDEDNPRGYLEE